MLTLVAAPLAANAQGDGSLLNGNAASEPKGPLPRRCAAEFVILDDQGEFAPRREAANADLARLVRLVPAGIVARLIESAEYDAFELGPQYVAFSAMQTGHAAEVPAPVARWLREGIADEVITGTVGMLQTSVVVTAQRYGLRDGQPALVGAAAVSSARVSDVVPLVDSLVEEVFTAEADIIARPIDQLFIVPSTLRLPMGRQGQLQVFAVDVLGAATRPGGVYLSVQRHVAGGGGSGGCRHRDRAGTSDGDGPRRGPAVPAWGRRRARRSRWCRLPLACGRESW